MEAQMLLRNSEVYPSNEVLNDVLGDTIYSVLESFISTITSDDYGLTIEWRYYNDGKAWLGKIVHKKKTVLWLSIWEGFFKLSYYFAEKHLEEIAALNISEVIKEEFAKAKPIGRLIPMIIDVSSMEQIKDILTIISLKKKLK